MEGLLQMKYVLVTWMKTLLHGDCTLGRMNTVLLAGDCTSPVIKTADKDIDCQADNNKNCFVFCWNKNYCGHSEMFSCLFRDMVGSFWKTFPQDYFTVSTRCFSFGEKTSLYYKCVYCPQNLCCLSYAAMKPGKTNKESCSRISDTHMFHPVYPSVISARVPIQNMCITCDQEQGRLLHGLNMKT
jgi:hypothetical protein